MAKTVEKYVMNPRTLMAELREEGSKGWWKWLLVLLSGILVLLLYIWISVSILGADLPKTAILKRRNADWSIRMDRMAGLLDRCEEQLAMLEVRDNKIYRSVYGMDEIPSAVRLSGLGGENRYTDLEGTALRGIVNRLDVLEKRAYIQSRSFDDVAMLQKTAGDMAAHIPAIPPMSTEAGSFHLSSPFGYRSDPLLGYQKRHTGMDFACPPGNPIYATGDGVVIKVAHERKGYGNHVEIDHGFGYKTRYAHMSEIAVEQGQNVTRGDYLKDYVNPALYMDLDIAPKDYFEIAKKPSK